MYFGLFAVVILLLLWLLQIVFLNTYYEGMKKKEVLNVANKITKSYGTSEFQDTIDEFAYDNGMNIVIYSRNGSLVYYSDISSIRPTRPLLIEYSALLNQIDNSKSGEFLLKTENSRFNIPTLIYGKLLNNSYLLYITTPLEPMGSTTHILASQLVYVTVIILMVGFIISLFISKRLADPIVKITDTANSLAKGNYDVIFEKGDYKEIDDLVTTLNYATRELSRTDNLRKELIANISHDLRTPLTMIKSYAEMLRDLPSDKNKKIKNLNVIIEETDRLSLLVNDIMNLSKLESKIDTLNITKFNLSELVSSITNHFSYLVERDKYVFEFKIKENLYVSADKEKIEQVMYNLISNAINYTGDDKRVIINLKGTDDHIRFEVKDSGSGISKKNMEHIWDRYYKVNKEHKRSVVGTGLGLYIVKNILMMHNARYGVDSIINKGSTFYFELEKENMK